MAEFPFKRLQVGGTTSTSNFYTIVFFYCTTFNKIQVLRTIYAICSYSWLQSLLIRYILSKPRSSRPEVSYKKGVHKKLTKFTGKHLYQGLFFTEACNFIKKETLAQVFSCEFCETSKKTLFTEHLWTTGSEPFLILITFGILGWLFR